MKGKKKKKKDMTMSLRRQLVAAFLSVAILPLIILGLFLFGSNLLLTCRLYEQSIHNSTAIQASLVEENINRLMVRAGHFVSSREVKRLCCGTLHSETDKQDISRAVLNFTDETIDSVVAFSLVNKEKEILYSSGSNSDIDRISVWLSDMQMSKDQYISEISFGEGAESLLIYTPVEEEGEIVGCFLIICRTDYFLKLISGPKQLQSSNSLIYCSAHQKNVISKVEFEGGLPKLDKKLMEAGEGSLSCTIGEAWYLIHYKSLSKIPWVLVTTVSYSQIFEIAWQFGFMGIGLLLFAFLAVIALSRVQSRRIIRPLEKLLEAVEKFFLSDTAKFPKVELDPTTEIGYLAVKFVKMSEKIAEAQGKIKESNYLYMTLLRATYELCITIDLETDVIETASEYLSRCLNQTGAGSAPERMLAYVAASVPGHVTNDMELLRRIVYGEQKEPCEAELCCRMREGSEECWYRIIAVTIEEEGRANRVVLHFEDITTQKHRELRLIHSSQKDPLCGLLNKAAFRLHCIFSGPGKTDVMFFIDLDRFKQLNDTLGHKAGDEMLITAARTIQSHFRETDAIARFGGDEFVIFAQDMTRKQAEAKGQELVKALTFKRDIPQGVIEVTASIGACLVRDSMTLEEALELADQAMYCAKENGKSQFCLLPREEV